jgi:predicted alpha/beta-hydrolase family hydrolase
MAQSNVMRDRAKSKWHAAGKGNLMNLLWTGPQDAAATLLLAHGAGAPMDTPFMNAIADGLAGHDIRCARFEFGYMAGRRSGMGRKPPPRAETVASEFIEAVAATGAPGRLVIGGKSMGGRVASMVAQHLFQQGRVAGLVCLGYPFHPPAKPNRLRTAHLQTLTVPSLICQGSRDPFGTREEVDRYGLSPSIAVHWLEDGDHDFKPTKASGLTASGNLQSAVERIATWLLQVRAKSPAGEASAPAPR